MLACSTVPVTKRSQMNLLSTSRMSSMAVDQYSTFLNENKVLKGTKEVKQVKTVGQKIAQATEGYLKNNGYKDRLDEFDWEFNVVDNEAVNAWCMPGGKVVFYTGILEVCQDKEGIAVVMGHEIAHAVARHGNERMSQGLAAQLGGMALSTALSTEPAATRDLFLRAYGLGAQVGMMLPFSRMHESEADQIGLIFMAKAGYNPGEAVAFWQRMEKQSGESPPEFLSTHPSHKTRIKDLKEHMDKAMGYYEQ